MCWLTLTQNTQYVLQIHPHKRMLSLRLGEETALHSYSYCSNWRKEYQADFDNFLSCIKISLNFTKNALIFSPFCVVLFHESNYISGKNSRYDVGDKRSFIPTWCLRIAPLLRNSRNPVNIRNPLIYCVNHYFLMFGGSQGQLSYHASMNDSWTFWPWHHAMPDFHLLEESYQK